MCRQLLNAPTTKTLVSLFQGGEFLPKSGSSRRRRGESRASSLSSCVPSILRVRDTESAFPLRQTYTSDHRWRSFVSMISGGDHGLLKWAENMPMTSSVNG